MEVDKVSTWQPAKSRKGRVITQPPSQTSPMAMQVAAVKEETRLRSIVIAHVPESTNTNLSLRDKEDDDKVRAIMNYLGVDVKAERIFRMGKIPASTETKSRLLKVVLPAQNLQQSLLKNVRKLRDSSDYKGIYVRASLTIEQRKEEAERRAGLRYLRGADIKNDWVIYRNEYWVRSEIGKGRTTIPPPISKDALNSQPKNIVMVVPTNQQTTDSQSGTSNDPAQGNQ